LNQAWSKWTNLLKVSLVAVAALLAACLLALVAMQKPAEAAFPGKNGRIAFCIGSGFAISSARPNGSGYRQETFQTSEFACEPAYSPDGTKLAFTSDQDDDYEIYVKNLASGRVTQLTNNAFQPDDSGTYDKPIQERRPAWSPDGSAIIFDRYGSASAPDLWVMDADGTDAVRLTHTTASAEWNAAWSPDGTKIAFVREDDVWVMDADGSDQEDLTRTPNLEDGYPSWSPNGAKIAWQKQSIADTPAYDVWKMNADGSGKDRLTFSAGLDATPAWSPDGGKIAFIRASEGDTDVWKMGVDGSRKTNVTDDDFDEIFPDWRPKPGPTVPSF
jgi:Tol biopolymer transport system component